MMQVVRLRRCEWQPYDGCAWGDWTSFRVTTQANTVPVVGSIADQSVAKVGVTKNISVWLSDRQ